MGAIIKTNDEKLKEMIEETARRAAESTLEKANANRNTGSSTESGARSESKVSQILKNANLQQNTQNINPDLDKEREELRQEKEKLEKRKADLEKHEKEHNHENEDLVDCPTCSKKDKDGKSVHKLVNIGHGKVACTGPNCGIEYALIPTKADYKCSTCGSAHKKPTVEVPDDKCPFCNNDDFLKYDWSKIIKPISKK